MSSADRLPINRPARRAGALSALALSLLLTACATPEDESAQATGDAQSDTSAQLRDIGEDLARRDSDDPFARGDVDAPVVMVAWSDYHCPFCGQWVRETQPELVEDYVETGELRIEWREFPYLGEDSTTLAHAAYAAGQQDLFWEFHEDYFAEEREQHSGADLEAEIDEIADETGLDSEQLRDDMDTTEAEEHTQADFDAGQELGINGTPAFFVNGEPVLGAQPTPTFVEAIESALDDAGEGTD